MQHPDFVHFVHNFPIQKMHRKKPLCAQILHRRASLPDIQLLSPFPLSLRYCVGVSAVSLLNMRAKLDALA